MISNDDPRFASPHSIPGRRRSGLTLVEMLVAMALTLVMMAAVAQIFGTMGRGVNGSRSVAELNDRMRATAYRLRQDLQGITVDPRPPVRPELNSGYLEIIEGPDTDLVSYATQVPFRKDGATAEPYLTEVGSDDRVVGDVDDIILFTTRSTGEPFSGKADTRNSGLEAGGFRSPFAEVVWFCRPTANTMDPRTYTLHRRQRLIAAHPGAEPFVDTQRAGTARNSERGPPNTLPFVDWPTLHDRTDISCRRQGALAIPNSLGDLTRREARFLHGETFPYVFDRDSPYLTFSGTSPRFGEDVLLTNVIAFDVRVWDDEAVVQTVMTGTTASATRIAVQPGDSAWMPGRSGERIGSYVDLGYLAENDADGTVASAAYSPFAGRGHSGWPELDHDRDGDSRPWYAQDRTYCSWSAHYGQLGIVQSAPYAKSLAAVEIRIRCYEPSSKQIRQLTVRHRFE
jgi:hypothetical protein